MATKRKSWWETTKLRDEIISASGAVEDVQVSLFNAFQDPASVFKDTVQDVAVLKIAGSALVQAREEHSA